MWQEVLDILIEKAKSGVEIRLMYDDFGSLMTLPYKYERYLSQYGIKSCVFGKLVPIWSVLINNRDHRKILVVDGKVGITGGINIADEYINDYEKHGYWKDSSVIIRGESVWSLTVFFLSSWGYVNGVNEDYTKYRFHQPDDSSDIKNMPQSGLVLPYLDSPLDKEPVGQNVYLNIINRAERYVYIETPYLVIDNEMMNALCNAAKQGIDVRIVTPHIPDHWYVHAVSKSNYMQLIESKVKIYEFTPGFIHSKIFICDDKISVVGTINMDYRSLFLHFEDAVFFYKSALIKDIYKDFMDILDKSQEITLDWCRSTPWYRKLGRAILKVFAPLM